MSDTEAISTETIRVLHVDDEPGFAEMAGSFLERADDRFAITTASAVDDGLDELVTADFDCIVSDYDMPGRNGLDFLKAVREHDPDLPFVLYTGKGSEEVASDALSAGATEYMQKESGTDHFEVLANRIASAVEQRHAQDVLEETRRQFSQLADRSDDVLWMFSADWEELLFINDAYEAVYGQSVAALEADPTGFLDTVHPDDRTTVREAMQRLSEGEPVDIEYRVNEAEAYDRWVWVQGQPIVDERGTVQRVGGFSRDITQRKAREQTLQRERDRFKTLFENLPVAAVHAELENGSPIVQQANPAFEETFGYDVESMVGDDLDSYIEPEAAATPVEKVNRRVKESGNVSERARRRTVDGPRMFHVETAVLDRDADPLEGYAIYVDITDEHRANSRLEALTDAFPDLAFIYDEEGRYLEVVSTPETDDLLVADDLVGKRIHDVFPAATADELQSVVETTLETGDQQTVEYEAEVPAGTRRFEAKTTPYRRDIDGEDVVIWVARDITERTEREQELQRYETIIEASGDPVYTLDAEGRFTFVNEALVELTGLERGELLGSHVSVLLREDDIDEGTAMIRSLLAGDIERGTFEMDVLTDDGWVAHENHVRLLPADGGFRGTVGVLRDITDRNERKQALQRTKSQLEAAIEAGEIATWEWQVPEDTFFAGAGFVRLFGVGSETARDGIALDRVLSSVHENDRDRVRERIQEAVDDCGEYEAEYRVRDAEGELRWVIARGHVECDDAGDPVTFSGAVIDVTEQKRAERELQRQNERLSEFASVVSHDLRSPLSVAAGRLVLAREECQSEHFDAIEEAIDRMDDLIEGLLELAREGETPTAPAEIDLAAFAETCWRTVDTADATLRTAGDSVVCADESRLRQLFENVFRNAVEHGGDDVSVSVGALDDGGFYIEDDGPGISPKERDSVFEMGYSTRPDGTGFGLDIVEQVCSAHSWEITVTRSDDGGARFEITGVETPPCS